MIFVFDLSEAETFETVWDYVKAFKQAEESNQKGFDTKKNVKYKKVIWGNKYDMKNKNYEKLKKKQPDIFTMSSGK